MAEISITTKLEELKVLFNQMKEVYYVSKVNSDLATLAAFDMELPVLSDGVTFDTGWRFRYSVSSTFRGRKDQ